MPAFRKLRAQGMKPLEHMVGVDEIEALDIERRCAGTSAKERASKLRIGRSAEARRPLTAKMTSSTIQVPTQLLCY